MLIVCCPTCDKRSPKEVRFPAGKPCPNCGTKMEWQIAEGGK